MAGRFIVFEGIDDEVLDEQARRMAAWLLKEGLHVLRTGEPTDGPIGTQIRLARSGRLRVDPLTLAALSLADRLDHLRRAGDGILASLARGHYVICTRYLLSAYAHADPEIAVAWLDQIHQPCAWPDLALWIDTPVDNTLRQFVEQEGYDSERVAAQRAALEARRAAYERARERCAAAGRAVHVIDGSQPAGTLQRLCRDLVEQLALENDGA